MIRIKNITPASDYSIEVEFENGTKKKCNIQQFLAVGDFAELKDQNLFKQVKNTGFSVEWPNDLDLSSDTLYAIGY